MVGRVRSRLLPQHEVSDLRVYQQAQNRPGLAGQENVETADEVQAVLMVLPHRTERNNGDVQHYCTRHSYLSSTIFSSCLPFFLRILIVGWSKDEGQTKLLYALQTRSII